MKTRALFIILAIAAGVWLFMNRPRDEAPYQPPPPPLVKVKKEVKEGPYELSKDAEKQFLKVKDFYDKENYFRAKSEMEKLINEYPRVNESDKVVSLLANIENKIQIRLSEKEKKEKKKKAKMKRRRRAALDRLRATYDKESGITWFKDLRSPTHTNANGIYLYFHKKDGKDHASNLRLKIQYHTSGKKLNIKKYVFEIDGRTFAYVPEKFNRDSDEVGRSWEWSDQTVDKHTYKIVKAIAKSESAKIMFSGDNGEYSRMIESVEKESMRSVLSAYKAFDGTFSF